MLEALPGQPRIPVAVRVAWLRERLARTPTLQWEQIAGATRDETIATFLAVLELVRRRELQVRQESSFGTIWLSVRHASTDSTNGGAKTLAPDQRAAGS